jgi:hypothetical protein
LIELQLGNHFFVPQYTKGTKKKGTKNLFHGQGWWTEFYWCKENVQDTFQVKYPKIKEEIGSVNHKQLQSTSS